LSAVHFEYKHILLGGRCAFFSFYLSLSLSLSFIIARYMCLLFEYAAIMYITQLICCWFYLLIHIVMAYYVMHASLVRSAFTSCLTQKPKFTYFFCNKTEGVLAIVPFVFNIWQNLSFFVWNRERANNRTRKCSLLDDSADSRFCVW
jgi:hypothetical protein